MFENVEKAAQCAAREIRAAGASEESVQYAMTTLGVAAVADAMQQFADILQRRAS